MSNKTRNWNKFRKGAFFYALIIVSLIYLYIWFTSAIIILNIFSSFFIDFFGIKLFKLIFSDLYASLFFVLLLIIAPFAYLKSVKISDIPKNSSLYDAIMNPTIQMGPIKVIIKVDEEEKDLDDTYI